MMHIGFTVFVVQKTGAQGNRAFDLSGRNVRFTAFPDTVGYLLVQSIKVFFRHIPRHLADIGN